MIKGQLKGLMMPVILKNYYNVEKYLLANSVI
jgi:hypothetical protein